MSTGERIALIGAAGVVLAAIIGAVWKKPDSAGALALPISINIPITNDVKVQNGQPFGE